MQYNVAQLLKESPGAQREYHVDEDMVLDDAASEHVVGDVKLMRTSSGVWAHAATKVEATCVCSRCLREFQQSIQVVVDEEYLPTVDVTTGLPVDLPEGVDPAEALTIDGQHILDIQEAVRQYRIAQAPMRPLCRPDCQGLCPVCGADLTVAPCNCRRERTDPRWVALQTLKVSDD
jgi:uncharacterized protein